MPSAPILVIQHEPACPPGWVGEWLTEEGSQLDVRQPYAGQHLPADLTDHGGLLVLGGAMGATDDARVPWLTDTKVLVRAAAEHGIPALGICLGHQLVAVALGGEVVVNPAGQQAGVLAVGWTTEAADDPLLAGCGSVGAHWNSDVVSRLPEGSTVLSRAVTGEVQAVRYAPTVWGVQWHPEAGVDIIRVWAEDDRPGAEAHGLDISARLRDLDEATETLQQAWRPLAANFAALTR